MRIFITGADGQLAQSAASIYPKEDLYLATIDDVDVLDIDRLVQKISAYKPDVVFHFASLTRGDDCAKNPEKAFHVNVDGTKNVVKVCKDMDISLLFVSTNEVFDGNKGSAYTEDDVPNPVTVVGKTKFECENLIMKELKKYFIVRTSWLYNEWSHNFLHAVCKKAKEDGKVSLVEDEISTPTYSLDLAQALKKLIETGQYGLYHLSNDGMASRLEFARKAFELCGLGDTSIVPMKLSEYKRLSMPPLFSALKNTKASSLGIVMPHWEDALERFLQKKSNNLV